MRNRPVWLILSWIHSVPVNYYSHASPTWLDPIPCQVNKLCRIPSDVPDPAGRKPIKPSIHTTSNRELRYCAPI
jgi:hypothetical protein